MKIYSILAHPNEISLNSSLFDYANQHFVSCGHEVKTLKLYEHFQDLVDASTIMTTSTTNSADKFQRSDVLYNFSTAGSRGMYTDFIKNQLTNLKESDILYIQTPIWVWNMPALLKLYIENTFLPKELFYQYNPASETDFKIEPLLTNKKVVCSFTFGSSRAMADSITGDHAQLFNTIKSTFRFVGYDWVDPFVLWSVSEHGDINSKKQKYFSKFNQYLEGLILN